MSRCGAQDSLIAAATAIEDRLLVITCAGEQLEIGFGDLPALKRVRARDRPRLEVASDGSYIHWPTPDIHLDVDSIRAVLDPAWRDRLRLQKAAHDERYGIALRALREAAGLTQRQIPGLSDRQVRRIEHGANLRAASLERYAAALSLSLAELLDAAAERLASRS
ncbi:MAG: hypothetical protein IT349_14240 [Candidatus Eisenbacteria bacterium]|nr:hypothetical protein [Candidatus Eisenbacteria bacterium]